MPISTGTEHALIEDEIQRVSSLEVRYNGHEATSLLSKLQGAAKGKDINQRTEYSESTKNKRQYSIPSVGWLVVAASATDDE